MGAESQNDIVSRYHFHRERTDGGQEHAVRWKQYFTIAYGGFYIEQVYCPRIVRGKVIFSVLRVYWGSPLQEVSIRMGRIVMRVLPHPLITPERTSTNEAPPPPPQPRVWYDRVTPPANRLSCHDLLLDVFNQKILVRKYDLLLTVHVQCGIIHPTIIPVICLSSVQELTASFRDPLNWTISFFSSSASCCLRENNNMTESSTHILFLFI